MKRLPLIIKKHPITPIYFIFLSFLVIYLDYLTGPFIQFPVLYLIPILLTSWYQNIWSGIGLAIILSMMRALFIPLWAVSHWTFSDILVNALIRSAVFVLFAYLVNKVSLQKQELERELNTLKGILPICGFCKKIRNDQGAWDSLEKYISEHSEAKFSHGMCPECAKKHYPDFFKE